MKGNEEVGEGEREDVGKESRKHNGKGVDRKREEKVGKERSR